MVASEGSCVCGCGDEGGELKENIINGKGGLG